MEKTIYFNSVEMSYATYGKGDEVIVLLHGFLEDKKMWDNLIPQLDDRKIIAIDLIGHGKSGVLNEISTMDIQAQMVHEILIKEEIKIAHVIGHSMGGYIGLAFLKADPHMVESLTLFHSTAQADNVSQKTNRDRAIRVVKNFREVHIRMSIRKLFADSFDDESVILEAIRVAENTSEKGIIRALEGMRDRQDSSELVMTTDKPIYYFVGERDNIFPLERMKDEVNLLKPTLVYYSYGSGHMGHHEVPGNVIEFINKIYAYPLVSPR